jgi:hypothetical protein
MASSQKSFKKEKNLRKEKRREEEAEDNSDDSRANSKPRLERSVEDCLVAPPFEDSGISAESSGSQDSIVLNTSGLDSKTDQKRKIRETKDSPQGLEQQQPQR